MALLASCPLVMDERNNEILERQDNYKKKQKKKNLSYVYACGKTYTA